MGIGKSWEREIRAIKRESNYFKTEKYISIELLLLSYPEDETYIRFFFLFLYLTLKLYCVLANFISLNY